MAIQRRTIPGRAYLKLADRLLRVDQVGGRKGKSGTSPPHAFGALPGPADIAGVIEDLLAVLFPGWGRGGISGAGARLELRDHLASVLLSLEARLEDAVFLGLRRRVKQGDTEARCHSRARQITSRFLSALPSIRALLVKDVDVHYKSDPAATGIDEIVSCYPGLYAIAVYRGAHELHLQGATIIPRLMTEHAHSRTGIDIHPGANIGPSFFIDHGTGIVIGETTIIGACVRIYQGVTLGALSVSRRDVHAPPTQKKRHPTIEDDVIIYANATILGGSTVIGRGAIIGGNAWITYSVPAGVRVGVGT